MISHLIRRVVNKVKGIAATDNFDRPNGAMGSTPVGDLVWEPISGTWQIQSNRAYTSTSQNTTPPPIVAVDSLSPDVDVSHDIASGGGDSLYFRIVDATNWWRIRHRRYSQQTSYSCTQYCTQYQYQGDYGNASGQSFSSSPCLGSHGHSDGVSTWCSSNSCCIASSYGHAHTIYYGDPCEAFSGNHHSHSRSSCYATGATQSVSCGTTTCYTTTYYYVTYLEKSVGGTVTAAQSVSGVAATSLRALAVGNSIRWFVNGVERTAHTDTDHKNATKHGPGRGTSELSSQTIDNFTLTPQD